MHGAIAPSLYGCARAEMPVMLWCPGRPNKAGSLRIARARRLPAGAADPEALDRHPADGCLAHFADR